MSDRPGNTRVLLVDDDKEVRAVIEDAMRSENYAITGCGSVREFEAFFGARDFDLFLVDINLPDGDGLEIAKRVRAETDAALVFITGRGDEIDTVLGLELGADDYIAKPVRVRELRARIKAVLRRSRPSSGDRPAAQAGRERRHIEMHGLSIDTEARSVRGPGGERIEITTLEFDVLVVLAQSPNRVLSRDQIMDRVRGSDWAAYDRTIDGVISRLRAKLFPDGGGAERIKTVRGVGYMVSLED